MSLSVGLIPKPNWSCSICLELMNGQEDTNGSVCISKRCMHIFHKACIERAIDESRSCPLCRCQIARAFIVDNPEHAEQCRQWEANPKEYTLETAFFRKYQKTPEEMELLPEDILRPESLHKEAWTPEISSEDKSKYYHECIERGYTFREILDAEDQVLDSIKDSFAAIRASNAEMFASYAEMHTRLDRIQASNAEMRASNAEIRASYAEIRASYAEMHARNIQSFKEYNERTKAYEELDKAYLERKKASDKLGEFLKKTERPSSSSNNPGERPWGTIIGLILGVFAIVIGVGYQFRDYLCRRFWSDRTITHQNEL